MLTWIHSLSRIGLLPGDNESVSLKKRFLMYQTMTMIGGGAIWSTIVFVHTRHLNPALIPLGFVVLTVLNLGIYGQTKSFTVTRNVQTSLCLLFPFIFQWCMGGYTQASEIMFWPIVAFLSSLSYLSYRESFFWFIILILLSASTILLDEPLQQIFTLGVHSEKPPSEVLVINVIVLSAIVFALMRYFFTMNDNNIIKVKETYNRLIQAEKHSAKLELEQKEKELEMQKALHEQELAETRLQTLTRITSEVAHEVQNPLQFVNNFSEVSEEIAAEISAASSLEEARDIAKDLKANASIIKDNGMRISKIVDQLLEQTRKAESGQLEVDDTNPHDFSK